MTPERQLTIIEHQTLDITHHIGRALHNTHQSMQDGYPTRSPGDGNPGGGSITATSRPPRPSDLGECTCGTTRVHHLLQFAIFRPKREAQP